MSGLPLFFVQTSVYNMTLLTVERYLKIVRPIWYKIHITNKKIVSSLTLPWIISFIYSLFFALLGNVNEDGTCNDEQQNDTLYSILMISAFITDFCLPIIAFIVCYMRIIYVIRNRVNPFGHNQTNISTIAASNQTSVKNKQIEKNALRMMLTVLFVYFASFIAVQIYIILISLEIVENSYSDRYFVIGMMGMMINSFINPLIYIAKYDEFRKCAKLMFGCK